MQDQQVEGVDTELAGRLLKRVQGLVVSVVGDPHLRLDEHVVPVHAGAAQAFTDLALVAVGGSSVDVSVSDAQRRLDGGSGLFGRALEDAEADGGKDDAVVEGEVHHEFFFRLTRVPGSDGRKPAHYSSVVGMFQDNRLGDARGSHRCYRY